MELRSASPPWNEHEVRQFLALVRNVCTNYGTVDDVVREPHVLLEWAHPVHVQQQSVRHHVLCLEDLQLRLPAKIRRGRCS